MSRRFISIFLSFCLILCSISIPIKAQPDDENDQDTQYEIEPYDDSDNSGIIEDSSTITVTIYRTVDDIIPQFKFSQSGGHGFAAEQGNNLIDRIKGNNAYVVGDNNIKNGPDRIIKRRGGSTIYIQDKYYNSASASVKACFDEKGLFKYLTSDGLPMQIEVPKDQYSEAVSIMEERIRTGKVPGVTDPNEAKNIIRKGNLTYAQTQNLVKAGTIESITYDAVHGTITAGATFGISTLLNYAVLRISREPIEASLKKSAISGLTSGAQAFGIAVIAGQLSKVEAINLFRPSTEALAKKLGEENCKKLLSAFGHKILADEGKSVAESATKQASKLIRANVLADIVTIIVLTAPEAVDCFNGRISKEQFIKNASVIIAGIVGATVGGWGVGAATLHIPVVNVVAPVIGSIVGSVAFSTGAKALGDIIVDDDAKKMYDILQNEFAQLCEDFLVNEDEATNIAKSLKKKIDDDFYKDMYQSKNRKQFANNVLTPLFEKEVKKREKIAAPSEEEMRVTLKEELKDIVFIH